MIGAIAGGGLAKNFGWRVAFMVVGLPGVVMALMIKLIVKEPPFAVFRSGRERPARPKIRRRQRRGQRGDSVAWATAPRSGELTSVAASLFGRWPVCNMVLGVTITSFAGYGTGAFAPPYFNRAFGLDYAVVGLIFGLIGGFSAGVGTLIGGFLSDWAGKRGARWYSLVPAIGLAIATPIYLLAYTWQLDHGRPPP